MVYFSLFLPYDFLMYSFLLILTLRPYLWNLHVCICLLLLFFHKIPFFIFFFIKSNMFCVHVAFYLSYFFNFDLIYMLIMVFKINCLSSMKTNRLILTKILVTFWKICFPICVDPTGSHETKIWASKTMIMNITPQRMDT